MERGDSTQPSGSTSGSLSLSEIEITRHATIPNHRELSSRHAKPMATAIAISMPIPIPCCRIRLAGTAEPVRIARPEAWVQLSLTGCRPNTPSRRKQPAGMFAGAKGKLPVAAGFSPQRRYQLRHKPPLALLFQFCRRGPYRDRAQTRRRINRGPGTTGSLGERWLHQRIR
jgi:hypothetical protein